MDETIYRQAALYAIYGICNEPVAWLIRAASEIEKLPSAQPEIIRCKDCIYWWESHKMCKRNKDKNHNCACMDCDADFYCKYAERRTDE